MALKDVSILLVEDDPVFRNLVSSFLVRQGASVKEADNGQIGLSLFKSHTFDVVLADLSMPVMGGLEMLREMSKLDPGVASIVISGNNVMADVVEALRIGASDYLVKPVADLFIIEQAIKQSLTLGQTSQVLANELDELTYQEFNENLALLEQNTEAAKNIQQQLFPASTIVYPNAQVNYSLFKPDGISSYFIDSTLVGDKHLVMYMAHFHPEDHNAAIASVLLRSFVNQKLKRFRSGINQTILDPFSMLSYLNERMVKSGLDIYVDIVYVVIELTHFRAAIAQAGHGLRCYLRNAEGLTPLALPETLQLGVLNWGQPSTQFRTLEDGERLCIATGHSEHRLLLLENAFCGLTYQQNVPPGGFAELAIDNIRIVA